MSNPLFPLRGRWLNLAIAGVVLVAIALAVVSLVVLDRKHFGWLTGSSFLPVIASGVFAGAILLLIGAWKLRGVRKTWRGVVLFCWALIALTSPLFGILFLVPWAALVVSLPLVAWILRGFHGSPRAIAA